ncbi:MAG TPA: anthranilate phosphoribosyltransferase [Fimbriimonadaceae bacterium]|nr:anthranilate phosphoribosyltransferase [Fimbriimonadaceae bacterium]
MTFPDLLGRLIEGADLGRDEASDLMRRIMSGALEDAQLGAVLTALRIKGASPAELAGFAEVMRQNASSLSTSVPNLVDTCGTGGGPTTFNLSTAAAIVAVAAGAKVAKHGNRGVTSACGSADVLEALGVTLGGDPEQLAKALETVGIVFLFAQHHHPAMRHVGPVRKALGVRTVFNQLGPLANPAGAKRQLVGVFDRSLVVPMAKALALLETEHSMVVHSEEGMDEVSPCGKTFVAEVQGGEVSEMELAPDSFGLEPLLCNALEPGGTVEENAKILREAISDSNSVRAKAILPNSAVALYLAGLCDDLPTGARMAVAAIEQGRAVKVLEEMAAWTS